MSKQETIDGVPLATPRAPAIAEMKQIESSVVNHHRLVNNTASFPDVQFVFDEDSKTLEAHHAILKARGPALLNEAKQKKKSWVVHIGKGKSKAIPNHQNALYRVLVYLYTGEVDWTTHSAFQAIEVLNLSKVYNLHHLAQINKKYIQDQISQQNVYDVLKYAHRLDTEEVKALCVDYALQNTEFFTSPKAKDVGFELFQEVANVLVKHYVKKMAPTVLDRKAPTVDSSIVEEFTAVYNSRNDSGDLVFKLIGEKQVKVHKAMLSCLSPELDNLLNKNPNSVVPTRPQITDQHIGYHRLTSDAFEGLLRFLYYGDKNFSLVHATQLFLFVKDFRLTALMAVLENVMATAEVDVQSVLYLLQIAFIELTTPDKIPLHTTLKNKGLQFVVAQLDKIDFKPLDLMPPIIGTAIIEAVQAAIKKTSTWENLKANFNKDPKPLPSSSATALPLPPPTTPPSSAPPALPQGTINTARSARDKHEKHDDETDSQLEASEGTKHERKQLRKKTDSKRPLATVEESKEKDKEKKSKKKD